MPCEIRFQINWTNSNYDTLTRWETFIP